MRIAICDDERNEISGIEDAIAGIQSNYQIDIYQSGSELLEAARNGAVYELVFLDIYLKSESGMDIARKLKEISPDTEIVFVTVSTEHAVEAFSIQALHYLVKPIRTENVVEAFIRLGNKRERRNTLTLCIERNVTVLFQDEIISVEGMRHRTLISSENDTVFSVCKSYGKISALLDESFLHIKKGVSVNMRYIAMMTAQKCIMKDGREYLLRRDLARELRDRYFAFVKNELDKN